jgi:hypothetical protein
MGHTKKNYKNNKTVKFSSIALWLCSNRAGNKDDTFSGRWT